MKKNKRFVWASVISFVLILACVLGIFAVFSEPVSDEKTDKEDIDNSDTDTSIPEDSAPAILSTDLFWTGSGSGGMVSYDCLYADGKYNTDVEIVSEQTSVSSSGVAYRFFNHCNSATLVCAVKLNTDDEKEIVFQIYPGGQMWDFITFEAGKTYYLYSASEDSSELPG